VPRSARTFSFYFFIRADHCSAIFSFSILKEFAVAILREFAKRKNDRAMIAARLSKTIRRKYFGLTRGAAPHGFPTRSMPTFYDFKTSA
jgi:hypothetical protein